MPNIKQHSKVLFLITIFLLSLNSISSSQTQTENEITVFVKPTQISRGETKEIYFEGKKLDEITSVEITPPEGISIKEIKEIILPEKEKEEEEEEKQKKWSILLSVDEDAELTERSVVLVTPNGRTKPITIEIIVDPPIISDLKILSSYSSGVEFTVNVFDEAGDLAPDALIYATVTCGYLSAIGPSNIIAISGAEIAKIPSFKLQVGDAKGGPGYMFRNTKAKEVTKIDDKNSLVRASISLESVSVSGACWLSIIIEDKNGYRSNELETLVNF
jgi:hypothetical protein